MRALRSIPPRQPAAARRRPLGTAGRLRGRPTPAAGRAVEVGSRGSSRLRRAMQQLAPEAVDQIAMRVMEMIVQRFTTPGTTDGPAVAQAQERDSPGQEDGWLRGAERIAAYLDCPRSRVYALASAGRIAVERDGSALVARKSDLDAWIRGGGGRRP